MSTLIHSEPWLPLADMVEGVMAGRSSAIAETSKALKRIADMNGTSNAALSEENSLAGRCGRPTLPGMTPSAIFRYFKT